MTGAVSMRLDAVLKHMPIVAILRGLRSDEAVAVVQTLFDAGIRVAEVPLNSPDPFTTIALLTAHFGDHMMIGAGTVIDPADVLRLAQSGGVLCVSPNTNPGVIAEGIRLGLVPIPGCATATEAFAAIAAGARHIKYFPAAGREDDIAALRAVLPGDVTMIAVGRIGPASITSLRDSGIHAFGIGSDLYKPGRAISEIATRAQALAAAAISKAPSARLVCNPEAAIGESPVGMGETIIWTDPVTSRLLRFADSKVEAKTLSRPVWSLAELPGGGLAGTFDDGFCTLDPASGALEAGPAAPLDPGSRFNDMTVDAAGGLWAGAMHRGVLAGKGAIFHASALDTAPACVARGLGVPNGMGFSADGRTLFVIDTLTRTLLSYPADSGTLGEPSIVTDFLDLPGKPDGMTIAPDGSLWVAMWGGGLVVQIARDGALLRTLSIPAPHISSLCFAGSSLFVTTSRMRLSPEQITRHPGSGGLFSIDLENVR